MSWTLPIITYGAWVALFYYEMTAETRISGALMVTKL